MSHRVTLLLAFAMAGPVMAELHTETIEYQDGEVSLAGHMAWDDATQAKRPGVLVVHEWWGLNDYARSRAEQLARMGYIAFALDMYGKDKVTEHPTQASKWAGMIRKNVANWQQRARAGLDVLRKRPDVDSDRLAAIGYCFGGATVLQVAYSGANLRGVVSFHGSLPVPTDEQMQKNKAKILVCHGAADNFIPKQKIQDFQNALEESGTDWQMIFYAEAQHSFTNPGADKKGIPGIAYNRNADRRSWAHMQIFFDEIFSVAN